MAISCEKHNCKVSWPTLFKNPPTKAKKLQIPHFCWHLTISDCISCACCVFLQPSSHPFSHPFAKTLLRRISWSNSQIGFAYRPSSWSFHSYCITNIVVCSLCECRARLRTILVVVSLFNDVMSVMSYCSVELYVIRY